MSALFIEVHHAELRDGSGGDGNTLDLNSFDGKEVAFIECGFEVCCKDLCEQHLGVWHYFECNINNAMVRRYMSS